MNNQNQTYQEILYGIQKCNALAELSPQEMEGLAQIGEIETRDSNETLFSFDDVVEHFYIVLGGKLRGNLNNDERKKFKVGAIFGEISFLGGPHPTGIVRVEQQAKLIKFSKAKIYGPTGLSLSGQLNLTKCLAKSIISYFYNVPESISAILGKGESETVEFKKSFSDVQKIAQTIVAMCNYKGGVILIGIDNDKTTVGEKPENLDGFLQRLDQEMELHVGPTIFGLFKVYPRQHSGKTIVRIDCDDSDQIILWTDKGIESIFVRQNATNRHLSKFWEMHTFVSRFRG